jgi:hypothetical protein
LKNALLIAAAGLALVASGVSAEAGCFQPNMKATGQQHPVKMPMLQHAGGQSRGGSIVGLWHVSHFVDDQLFFDSFDQWFSDGNELEFANIPPATGDLCLGTWTKSGKTISLWHTGWTFNADGSSSGTMVLTESLKVKGDTFSGPFEVKFFDTDGNLVGDFSGTSTAERLGN